MDSSPPVNVSIIVPVHDSGPNFQQCLSSLIALHPGPLEIIVVADGCINDLSAVASWAGAKVVKLFKSFGPARARNEGAMKAEGDFLLFIDSDVLVPSNAILQIEHAFQNNPGLAAVFGSYDDSPKQTNFLSQYKNLLHHYIHQTGQEEASTFWGACGVIKKDIFMEIGGFDEGYYKPSIEDIELGYRLVKSDYKIRLLKTLQVKHLKKWGVRSLLESDVFDRAIPWTQLILKDRRFINDLNTDAQGRISVALIYGLLFSFLIAIGWPKALFISGVMGMLLLIINLPVYHFFRKRRCLSFTIKVIPWHWFYYFYCGIGFIFGVIGYIWRNMAIYSKK